jgi:methylated-DNA-[protein]-cysteine S-methyltransferase
MGSSRRLHAREDAAAREVQSKAFDAAIGDARGETWRIERVSAPIAARPASGPGIGSTIWLATDADGRLVATAFDEVASIEAHAARFAAKLAVDPLMEPGVESVADPRLESRERADRPSAAAIQIAEYLDGTRTSFDVELRLLGTAFQRAAWLALTFIPFGETRSYAEQARVIGRPTALRAIGAANGRNPIPLVVPCHRVVASDGGLGGFTGGLALKRRLLAHEARIAGPRASASLAALTEPPNGPLFAN